MKRYIVTEDELEELQNAAFDLGKEWFMWAEPMKSMAASDLSEKRRETRKNEVPDWATHFACGDETIMKTWESFDADNWQEIQK